MPPYGFTVKFPSNASISDNLVIRAYSMTTQLRHCTTKSAPPNVIVDGGATLAALLGTLCSCK